MPAMIGVLLALIDNNPPLDSCAAAKLAFNVDAVTAGDVNQSLRTDREAWVSTGPDLVSSCKDLSSGALVREHRHAEPLSLFRYEHRKGEVH